MSDSRAAALARADKNNNQDSARTNEVRFETDVLPILKANCVQCHGPDIRMKDLNLSTLVGVLKGGESGPALVPGRPDESRLYKTVREGSMPKGGKPLSEHQVATIRAWIEAGAPSAMTFEAAVLPIFQANCVHCHGAEVMTKSMNLSTYAGVMKGSESGAVVVPGKPQESLLYKKVREGLMPKGGKALPEGQVATIRAWIEAGAPSASESVVAKSEPLTLHDVLPIMFLRCTACHSPRRLDGGLDLSTRAAMLKGGKSGPALVPSKPDQSLIAQKLRSGEMPPKKGLDEVSVRPITKPETERLLQWIAQGAPEGNVTSDSQATAPDLLVSDKDREFWAFQPPKRPAVPPLRHQDRVRNPIDAFVLSKLEAKGLSFSPEADKLILVRRAYFDLTGLPPTPDEVQAFLADRDHNAYDKLIDRLLASPRYGDCWGRYWLDLAGYSDSEGGKIFSDNFRPYAWRYRDYVVRSFNADKPYDRFLLEQIAGDELEDYEHAPVVTQQMMDNVIATGFLRMAPDSTYDPTTNSIEDRLDVVGDEIDVLGSGVLGLTLKCARCHSHKYDPIPQRDYYRLAAVFKGAYDYYDWLMPQPVDFTGKPLPVAKTRFLPYVTPGLTPAQLMAEQQEREAHNDNLDREIKTLKDALEEKAEPVKKKILDESLANLPASLREDLRKTLDTPPEQRNEVQKYLAEKFKKILKVKPEDLKKADARYKLAAEDAEKKIKLLETEKIPEPRVRALWDRGEPSPTYILRRGDPANPGPLVGPGVPAVLSNGKTPFVVTPPWPGAPSTGRRLAFARWLIRPENPLTARVMVNRIWARHFGAGIVKTLGNFGHTGAPPTNPELLDWLATEFARQGWSVKAMQRLMMTSSAYRQSSAVTPLLERLDPDDKLLSRMPMRRMEAELLFDTLLFAAGRLDETRYGPPQPVQVREDGMVTPIATEKGWRRSIYIAQRRSEVPTLLDSFDFPALGPNCLERNTSTVAIQALHMMNNAMVDRLAGYFAGRLEHEVGSDGEKQIERAYWIALSRPPTQEEMKISLEGFNRFRSLEARSLRQETLPGSTAAPNAAPPKPRAAYGTSKLGGGSAPPPGAPSEARAAGAGESASPALAQFCHALLNSAAFLYID